MSLERISVGHSVATTVADCSRLPEQHKRKLFAQVLIASGVVRMRSN